MIKIAQSIAPWTGERFIPGVAGPIEAEHLHRYWLANKICADKDVLDIACGEGYGSYILSHVAKSVIGVDTDEPSIDHAKRTYQCSNLNYLLGSCQNIPISSDSLDVVVSFETLEHIFEQNDFLQEIKRVLRKDGVLVVSTPDKRVYSDIPNYKNEFHLKELYEHEFQILLSEKFAEVELLRQEVLAGSFILKENRSEKHIVSLAEKTGDELRQLDRYYDATYMIALASDGPLPQLDESIFTLPPAVGNHLFSINQVISSLNEDKRLLEDALKEKEFLLGDMRAQLSKLKACIEEPDKAR